VTLSPVIAKIFECVLLIKYGLIIGSLVSKKKLGCCNAIFAVRNIVTNFNERGSNNLFMVSLDASKVFDRVNHFRLYTALS